MNHAGSFSHTNVSPLIFIFKVIKIRALAAATAAVVGIDTHQSAGVALGIIGDAFIAEIDAVFQYPHALPVLSVIAVVL